MAITIKAVASTPASPGFTLQEVTAYAPFSTGPDGKTSIIQISGTVAGSSSAHVELFDPTNAIEIWPPDPTFGPSPLIIRDTTAGKNLFQGWIQKVGIRVVATYRWLLLDAIDLNDVGNHITVGNPDGISGPQGTWTGPDSNNRYILIDPNAQFNGGSDQLAIQELYGNYFGRYPYVALNTTTYVELINPQILTYDPAGNLQIFYWDRTNLNGAVSDVCALSSPSTISWIDADGNVHLTQMPVPVPAGGGGGGVPAGGNSLARMLPQATSGGGGGGGGLYPAPVALTDDETGAGVGYENFTYQEDSTGFMLSAYVRGQTDWAYNPSGTALIPAGRELHTVTVPIVEVGGTGLVGPPGTTLPLHSWLEPYIDVPQAINQAIRDSVGQTAVALSQVPLIRGACDVVGTTDIWSPGMILTITNTPANIIAQSWMIQAVDTVIMTSDKGVLRRAKLQWGTAPATRLGLQASAQRNAYVALPKPKPGGTWVLLTAGPLDPTNVLPPGTFVQSFAGQGATLTFQFSSIDGKAVPAQGLVANITVLVFNLATDVTTARDWDLSNFTPTSDKYGQVTVVLLMASNFQPGDRYTVWAVTQITAP